MAECIAGHRRLGHAAGLLIGRLPRGVVVPETPAHFTQEEMSTRPVTQEEVAELLKEVDVDPKWQNLMQSTEGDLAAESRSYGMA